MAETDYKMWLAELSELNKVYFEKFGEFYPLAMFETDIEGACIKARRAIETGVKVEDRPEYDNLIY